MWGMSSLFCDSINRLGSESIHMKLKFIPSEFFVPGMALYATRITKFSHVYYDQISESIYKMKNELPSAMTSGEFAENIHPIVKKINVGFFRGIYSYYFN